MATIEPLAGRPRMVASMPRWRRAAMAAAIVLAALAAGYGLRGLRPAGPVPARAAPMTMSIDGLSGVVLVKHDAGPTWEEMRSGRETLFVGDTLVCLEDASLVLRLPDDSRVALAAGGRLTLSHQNGGLELACA